MKLSFLQKHKKRPRKSPGPMTFQVADQLKEILSFLLSASDTLIRVFKFGL